MGSKKKANVPLFVQPEIRMDGALGTKSHSDGKCPIGKSLTEMMSLYFLGTWGHKMSTTHRYESCPIENFLKGTMSLDEWPVPKKCIIKGLTMNVAGPTKILYFEC